MHYCNNTSLPPTDASVSEFQKQILCPTLYFFVPPFNTCLFLFFFASLCNFWAALLYKHKKLLHFVTILLRFVITCRINLGMSLYIFDGLAIFPTESSHGEDDQRILHLWSLSLEKTQITSESLISVYRYKCFI